jgi:hypothetical protein
MLAWFKAQVFPDIPSAFLASLLSIWWVWWRSGLHTWIQWGEQERPHFSMNPARGHLTSAEDLWIPAMSRSHLSYPCGVTKQVAEVTQLRGNPTKPVTAHFCHQCFSFPVRESKWGQVSVETHPGGICIVRYSKHGDKAGLVWLFCFMLTPCPVPETQLGPWKEP